MFLASGPRCCPLPPIAVLGGTQLLAFPACIPTKAIHHQIGNAYKSTEFFQARTEYDLWKTNLVFPHPAGPMIDRKQCGSVVTFLLMLLDQEWCVQWKPIILLELRHDSQFESWKSRNQYWMKPRQKMSEKCNAKWKTLCCM